MLWISLPAYTAKQEIDDVTITHAMLKFGACDRSPSGAVSGKNNITRRFGGILNSQAKFKDLTLLVYVG